MKHLFRIYAGLCLALIMVACGEDVNDWGVDDSYARLFTPISMSVVNQTATTIQLQYEGVNDAEQYVFEFSGNGNQDFSNIIRTEVVLADTLKAYTKGNTPAKTKYRILFGDLYGQQSYSVRMKGVNKTKGLESHYISLAFETKAEQIFEKILARVDGAKILWDASKTVTDLQIGRLEKNADGAQDTTWIQKVDISHITTGVYDLTSLTPGTKYVAKIYNQQILRGVTGFKTLGSAKSKVVHVSPNANVNLLLLQASGDDITLTFDPGNTYELGYVTVPTAIKHLYFAGYEEEGKMPLLHLSKVTLSAQMKTLNFSYVDIDNQGKSTYLLQLNTAFGIDDLSFENATVRNIKNSLLQVSRADVKIGTVNISDCLLNNIGYVDNGLIYVASAGAFETLAISNTTMVDMGKQLMDIRAYVDSISIDQVTFYNSLEVRKPFDQFARFGEKIKPRKMAVTNSIIAGPNGGVSMSAGMESYSFLSFSKSYLTSDLRVGAYPFTKATLLEIPSNELFVDPANGDFHFRSSAKFEGDGKAGDRRWWTTE